MELSKYLPTDVIKHIIMPFLGPDKWKLIMDKVIYYLDLRKMCHIRKCVHRNYKYESFYNDQYSEYTYVTGGIPTGYDAFSFPSYSYDKYYLSDSKKKKIYPMCHLARGGAYNVEMGRRASRWCSVKMPTYFMPKKFSHPNNKNFLSKNYNREWIHDIKALRKNYK